MIEECPFAGNEAEKCELLIESLTDKVKRMYFDRRFTPLHDLLDSFRMFDRASGKIKNGKVKTLRALNLHEDAKKTCSFVNTERQHQPKELRQGQAIVYSDNDKPQRSHRSQKQFYRQKDAAPVKIQVSSHQK